MIGQVQGGPDLAEDIARIAADIDGYDRFYGIRWADDLLQRQHEFLKSKLEAMKGIDFDALGQSGKVDYLLMRNDIRAAITANRLAARQLAEMDGALAVRSIIVPLELARWRMEKLDPKACAAQLNAIPGVIKGSREKIEEARKAAKAKAEEKSKAEPTAAAAGPSAELSPVAALRASRAIDQLERALGEHYDYYEGFEPAFTWWCEKPYGEARTALRDFSKFLREDLAGVKGKPEDPLIGDPIGREALLESLRDEHVALSPEELIAVGEKEFAWCEAQMKAAAKEMGFGDGSEWKKALDKVKQGSQDPGEQTAYVTDVSREAIAFLKQHDLVSIPPLCEETWRIQMISPQGQRSLPFAVYYGQAIGVAYPHQSMTHDDKMMSLRGNNRHFTRIVVPHELIPGHHLQAFMSKRERPYRGRFSTPFFVEGWALYWEMKLWDMNWAKSPEDRIGMLFWRMHRCARIVVSLKFHLGQMSPQEMIDYLVDRVGHEKFGATSEVRRYIGGDYSPLYQCGYMIGGKQLRALWLEAVGDAQKAPHQRGRMTEKQFNDAVMHAGMAPIELLRAELLNLPLTRDSEASWRFDRE